MTTKNGDYSDAQYERKAHGAFIIDGHEVAYTLMCPHCGSHFVSRKGSGARRTFCMKCMAVTCGNPTCDACKPFEQMLDEIERAAKMAIPGKG